MQAKPFLKWAGGKTQLLGAFEALYPPGRPRRYLEPFVGSGAVFFHVRRLLQPQESILADENGDLINVYRVVRDDTERLVRALRRHRATHDRDHYYKVRDREPARLTDCARAARFIYLNRTCYNGLYRLNRSGRFNVPMGRYENPAILDAGTLRAAGEALRNVTLRVAPFGATASLARRGDFVYFDPPYDPVSRTASFTAYTDRSFGRAEQETLAETYRRLHDRGCHLMLSNSDTRFVRELYRGFDIRTVTARRSINAKGGGRGRVREVVVLNYTPLDRSR